MLGLILSRRASLSARRLNQPQNLLGLTLMALMGSAVGSWALPWTTGFHNAWWGLGTCLYPPPLCLVKFESPWKSLIV